MIGYDITAWAAVWPRCDQSEDMWTILIIFDPFCQHMPSVVTYVTQGVNLWQI